MTLPEWIRQLRRRRIIEDNGQKLDAITIEAMRRRADELEERLRQNDFAEGVRKALRGDGE